MTLPFSEAESRTFNPFGSLSVIYAVTSQTLEASFVAAVEAFVLVAAELVADDEFDALTALTAGELLVGELLVIVFVALPQAEKIHANNATHRIEKVLIFINFNFLLKKASRWINLGKGGNLIEKKKNKTYARMNPNLPIARKVSQV